jgi:TonB family protein
MISLFNYLLESGAALGIFYLFYGLLLRRQANFSINRIYLTGAVFFSLLIPFIEFTISPNSIVTPSADVSIAPVFVDRDFIHQPGQFHFAGFLRYIYFIGLVWFGVLFLMQHKQLHQLFKAGKIKNYHGYKLVCLESNVAPFSHFNRIFIRNSDLTDPVRFNMIFMHETMHIRKLHYLDNYLVNLAGILQWYNPFLWLIKRELRNVHEYEADQATVEKTGQPGMYKRLLFSQTMGLNSLSFVNHFHSSIKNRLLMLDKKRSFSGVIRGLVFIPLVLALLFYFSCNEQENEPSGEAGSKAMQDDNNFHQQNGQKQKSVPSKGEQNTPDDKTTFRVVEDMPKFKGKGIRGFRDWVQERIKYPKEALDQGIEGKVFVQFVINKQGEITNVKVLRGVHEKLNDAAAEVIRNAPNWEPGRQRGQKVNVKFTIPIVFKL